MATASQHTLQRRLQYVGELALRPIEYVDRIVNRNADTRYPRARTKVIRDQLNATRKQWDEIARDNATLLGQGGGNEADLLELEL
jgi:hypothetical protein